MANKKVGPNIKQESYDIIKSAAEKDDRSLYWLLGKILNDWAENYEKKNKPKAKKPAKTPVNIVGYLLQNDGEQYPIDQEFFDLLVNSYPLVNIEQEFKNIAAWLHSNADKRKTKSGMKRFVNTWMSKTQNKGGHNGQSNQAPRIQRRSH